MTFEQDKQFFQLEVGCRVDRKVGKYKSPGEICIFSWLNNNSSLMQADPGVLVQDKLPQQSLFLRLNRIRNSLGPFFCTEPKTGYFLVSILRLSLRQKYSEKNYHQPF